MFAVSLAELHYFTVNGGPFWTKLGAVFDKSSFTPVARADIEQLGLCFCDLQIGPLDMQFGPQDRSD